MQKLPDLLLLLSEGLLELKDLLQVRVEVVVQAIIGEPRVVRDVDEAS